MKDGIHPAVKDAEITCACGNVIKSSSTLGHYKIDVCHKCHPFFTGEAKLMDAEGRVERFKRKYQGRNSA